MRNAMMVVGRYYLISLLTSETLTLVAGLGTDPKASQFLKLKPLQKRSGILPSKLILNLPKPRLK